MWITDMNNLNCLPREHGRTYVLIQLVQVIIVLNLRRFRREYLVNKGLCMVEFVLTLVTHGKGDRAEVDGV